MTIVDSPNRDFIATWNDILTPKWLRFRDVFAANSQANHDAVADWFPLRQGEQVLDVGCSFGESSRQFAYQVGPNGRVLGIDCTDSFIAIAQSESPHLSQLSYVCGDAQSMDLGESQFDLCYSRFGVMFFAQHVLAFRNFYRALKPGGRINLIVWRGLSENECFYTAKQIAQSHLPSPGEDAKTCGPGPFFMFDKHRNHQMLEAAGFTEVESRPIDILAPLGRDLDEAVAFQLQIGPMGEIIREAGDLGLEKLPIIERDVRAFLSGFQREGGIRLPTASWAIRAVKPD